jgi:hypothetical protein
MEGISTANDNELVASCPIWVNSREATIILAFELPRRCREDETLEHDRFKLKRESCSKTLIRDRFTFDVDCESDATSNDRALVVGFRHLHPGCGKLVSKCRALRTTSNFMKLVELLNLTFEHEIAAGRIQTSNLLH